MTYTFTFIFFTLMFINKARPDNEFTKKMNILAIIRDRGKDAALRLYPEHRWYIDLCAKQEYEVSKMELFKEFREDYAEY